MANETAKCAHEPCRCTVPAGQAYCSDYCKHVATSGPPRKELICDCGHKGCAGA